MGPFSRCLSTLIYHRITPEPDPLLEHEVCARDFEAHLAALARWFTVLPLPEAVARIRDGTLPVRAACVTFDDGYADNATVALPILRRHGVPATFFVATSYLDGGRMFNDTAIETVRAARGPVLDARAVGLGVLDISTLDLRREAIARLVPALKYLSDGERQERVEALRADVGCVLPLQAMMTDAQVRELKNGGMEIGAHTVTHPILASIETGRAATEIRDSKSRLEAITGAPVRFFAYPNGKPSVDYRREHVDMVREAGFEAAMSTAWGVAHAASDLYQLPRFTPWDRTPGRFLLRLAHNTFRTAPEKV